ncbi:FUSC family protein, partial [Escherichia coli]|nr:FUSC family protein [Escherichia coli]
EPILLSLAVALWVALCLYVSLLDRTPASYLPMLAGYTAALIGFPAVDDPGAIFDTAVARAEEISLGIVCASLAARRSAGPPIAAGSAWRRGWR